MSRQLQLAWDAADAGMARAVEHAGPPWEERATQYLKDYLAVCGTAVNPRRTFLTEDVRAYSERFGLPEPPDKRAWGAIITRAKRDGLIRKVGSAPAASSNTSLKTLWMAA